MNLNKLRAGLDLGTHLYIVFNIDLVDLNINVHCRCTCRCEYGCT